MTEFRLEPIGSASRATHARLSIEEQDIASEPTTSKAASFSALHGLQHLPDDPSDEPPSPSSSPHSSPHIDRFAPADPLDPNYIRHLPPTDGGRDAWLFLAASTTVEMLIWGLPYSIGVLHAYWTSKLFGPGSESLVTLAATLQAGLMYMLAAVAGPLFAAFPRWTKQIQYAGLFLATISLLASAFATRPWHLLLTIGCLYPFAGATYTPCATLLYEWFSAKRGLATGVMFAGTGAGGTVFPFIIAGLLSSIGYKPTMLALGATFGIVNSIALLYIKRRVPLISRTLEEGRRPTRIDVDFLKTRAMMVGMSIILFTSMGNFIPTLWVPSFADDLNLRNPNGTALVALMNATSVPGATILGLMSDHLPIRVTTFLSCAAAALSCMLLWGFGKTDGPLVAFALVWGITGLSFVGLWSKIISLISGDDTNAPTIVFSVFSALKGVGNFTSGPLSDFLLKINAFHGATGVYGYKNYGVLLVYTGAVMFSGGLAGMCLSPPKPGRRA